MVLILRVSFQPYLGTHQLLGAGVSLRLKSVQVKDLVEGNGQSAEANGFSKVHGDSSEKNTGSEDEEVRKKFPKQPTSKFKSKLEEDFNDFLIKQKIKFGYEDYKVSYLKPEKYLNIRQTLIVQL